MNRKKTVREKSYEHKILKLLCIILFIGGIIGFLLGQGITSNKYRTSIKKYGIISATSVNHKFTDLVTAVELGFKPLNVDMEEELQEYIYCLSYANDIDFEFVMGLIKKESEFNPNAISETNDYGLMQINQINHKWLSEELGITDFNDPYQNVRAGIHILRDLFDEYKDNSKVLMAYNMGETGAKRLWVQDVYESEYSKEVLENVKDFKMESESND